MEYVSRLNLCQYYSLYGGMWKTAIIGSRSQGALHLQEIGHYSTGTLNLERNPPCNAEDNLRAGLVVIEAWFGGY